MTQDVTRCVGARVDWLTVAFCCQLPAESIARLHDRARFAAEKGCAVEFQTPDGWRAAVAPTRRADWFRLESSLGVAVVDLHAPGGWCVVVELSGEHCAWVGSPVAALMRASGIAGSIIDGAAPLDLARLRRVDLAADFVGFPLSDIEPDSWLTRRRCTVGRYDADEESSGVRTYSQGRSITGFTVAPGNPLMARIYDKTAQLAASHDEERAAAEESRWRLYGWDKHLVTRVEYQLRGEALGEIGKPPLRDAAASLPDQLDATWSYLSSRWLQLIQLGTASRRSRCALDARWEAVQAVVFSDRAAPAPRVRRTGRAAASQAVGCALSAQADAATLAEPPSDDDVARMTEPGAALYAHGLVHGAMAQTAEDYLAALLAKHHGDARAVASYLAAKVSGIRAARG